MSNSNPNRLDRSGNATCQRYSEENENQDERDEDSLLEEEGSEYLLQDEEEEEDDEEVWEGYDSEATILSNHRRRDRRGSTNTTPATSDAEGRGGVRRQTSTPSPRQSTRLGGRKPSSLGWQIEYNFILLIIERIKKGRSFNHNVLRAILRRAMTSKWVICSFQDIGLTCFLHLCRFCRKRGVSYI